MEYFITLGTSPPECGPMGVFKQIKDMKNMVAQAPGMVEQAQKMASMTTGSRKVLSSAIVCDRLAASFHSSRK